MTQEDILNWFRKTKCVKRTVGFHTFMGHTEYNYVVEYSNNLWEISHVYNPLETPTDHWSEPKIKEYGVQLEFDF